VKTSDTDGENKGDMGCFNDTVVKSPEKDERGAKMIKKTRSSISFFLLTIMAVVVWFSSPSYSMITTNPNGYTERDSHSSSSKAVTRFTVFLKYIKGNVLYTDTDSYSLQNVRITYISVPSDALASPNRKKAVELIFFGDVLKEVVIHR